MLHLTIGPVSLSHFSYPKPMNFFTHRPTSSPYMMMPLTMHRERISIMVKKEKMDKR